MKAAAKLMDCILDSCICPLLGSILEAAEDKWEACDSGYSRKTFELSCQCSSLGIIQLVEVQSRNPGDTGDA